MDVWLAVKLRIERWVRQKWLKQDRKVHKPWSDIGGGFDFDFGVAVATVVEDIACRNKMRNSKVVIGDSTVRNYSLARNFLDLP